MSFVAWVALVYTYQAEKYYQSAPAGSHHQILKIVKKSCIYLQSYS